MTGAYARQGFPVRHVSANVRVFKFVETRLSASWPHFIHGHIFRGSLTKSMKINNETLSNCQSTPPRQTLNENKMLKIIVILY